MKNNIQERICIGCPAGCHLTIRKLDSGDFEVSGNTCPRGRTYAVSEMTDPRRIVTACVPVNSPAVPCLPVKTSAPLPMKLISSLVKQIYAMRLDIPASAGTVLIRDFAGSKVDVVLTRGAAE